ncbi:transcriptional regulator NrdR [ [[Propionibacterium] namnetense SK182B-JCVI]|uniref:Transcriptional repressor NrdR n=2 Tax=Cutibacterium namnetense TaxID=1574624 RepID=F9NTI8_9ACTN|nr:transcriptional regulator NrdR [ [[Propionibacterium] namnetense SK182B-JCVI]
MCFWSWLGVVFQSDGKSAVRNLVRLGKEAMMRCPFCQHDDSRVLDSRVCEDGTAIRRRRQCPMCERRFTTIERMQMTVHKRNGIEEPFSRDKVIRGVRNACKGRPVTDADLALLGQRVEDGLRARGIAEIPSEEIGLAILGPLRELDSIAYLRFASVYLNYDTIEDFATEIDRLRDESSDKTKSSSRKRPSKHDEPLF